MSTSRIVLGLSLGTQLMGLAIVKGRQLQLWEVKNFEGKWSNHKLQCILRTVDRYMEDNQVSSVVLKIPESCRSSPALETLTEAIMKRCTQRGIQCHTCTSPELKTYCAVRNRRELMQYVVTRHPELTHVLKKAKQVRKVYYVRIFEAVLATYLV